MTMELGSNGCDAPCTACGVRCAVCSDVSGNAVSMLLTLPDIVTQTDPDPTAGSGGGRCDTCEDILAITHELELFDEGTAITLIDVVDSNCPFENDVDLNDSNNYCMYGKQITCGRPTVFDMIVIMLVIIYRTTGGDLWAKVYYSGGYSGSSTFYRSDEFELAVDATQFDCGALDHDGTFSACSGSDPTIWCSSPVDYNLTVAT